MKLLFFIITINFVFNNYYVKSLKCFAGLNEYSLESSSKIEINLDNTDYTCGNNSNWDEIIYDDSDWYCMVTILLLIL